MVDVTASRQGRSLLHVREPNGVPGGASIQDSARTGSRAAIGGLTRRVPVWEQVHVPRLTVLTTGASEPHIAPTVSWGGGGPLALLVPGVSEVDSSGAAIAGEADRWRTLTYLRASAGI